MISLDWAWGKGAQFRSDVVLHVGLDGYHTEGELWKRKKKIAFNITEPITWFIVRVLIPCVGNMEREYFFSPWTECRSAGMREFLPNFFSRFWGRVSCSGGG
jgi:hypothetical protein